MTNTARFTTPPVVGTVVSGVSEGTSTKGQQLYSTEWSGIYDGIRSSEWDGKPVHFFHDGIIGVTPQHCFAVPVSHFPAPAEKIATPGVTTWCKTCGNPVERDSDGNRPSCSCWCFVAEALQRYLGMDFDGAAQMAADLWRSEGNHEYVWSAEYANDHDVEVYQDTRAFAPADVREQDRKDFPHDEDCPKCGRRQWGGPDPYETCEACGYVMTDDDV